MTLIVTSLGECPICGDELVLIKTSSANRMAKCLNDHCPKKFTYPLPKRGQIEVTGSICPKTFIPLIVIIPLLRVNNTRIRAEYSKAYCWTQGPCFSCRDQKKCGVHIEILDEYGEVNQKKSNFN